MILVTTRLLKGDQWKFSDERNFFFTIRGRLTYSEFDLINAATN